MPTAPTTTATLIVLFFCHSEQGPITYTEERRGQPGDIII